MEKDNCCGITPLEMEELQSIEKNLKTLITQGGVICYHKDHILFYEGHAPYGFYILKKGKVELSRINLKDQKVILPSHENKLFGLFHLITNTPYCATAQAKTDTEVIFIPKSLVLDFLHHHH